MTLYQTLQPKIRFFDLFGEPVPQINMNGSTTHKTTCGGLVSLSIWASIIAFVVVRMEKLIYRDDPIIYEVTQALNLTQTPALDFKEHKLSFGMAFYTESYD
jgi:hypothetical protein